MAEEKNKILNFESYRNKQIDLHYYAFDIDDNLFHMPTVIHMLKKIGDDWEPIDVSTSEFAKVRNDNNYKLLPGNESFSEFRDNGPRGDKAFIEDMKVAIRDGLFGPAWQAFKKCLSEGSLFALITARGNEPSTYRNAVEYIIDEVLSDNEKFLMYSNCIKHAYLFSNDVDHDRIPRGRLSQTPLIKLYLDHCEYYGVSSDTFAKEFGVSSASNPEKAKEMALDKFINDCNEYGKRVGAKTVSVGFSDDDPKNVEHVHKYFKEKSLLNTQLKLNLYKTTDVNKKGGERTKFITGDEFVYETSNQAIGLESSVIPFSKWNNMTQTYYPSTKDAPKDDFHNAMKNKLRTVIDLYEDTSLNSREEMLDHLCNSGHNRPELAKMSDKELIRLCKEYPYEVSESKSMSKLKLNKMNESMNEIDEDELLITDPERNKPKHWYKKFYKRLEIYYIESDIETEIKDQFGNFYKLLFIVKQHRDDASSRIINYVRKTNHTYFYENLLERAIEINKAICDQQIFIKKLA